MRYFKYFFLLISFVILTSCNEKLSTSDISCDENLACPNDYYCANENAKICCPENMYYDSLNKKCSNICDKNPCGENQICKPHHEFYFCECPENTILSEGKCISDLMCKNNDVFCNDSEYCYNGACFFNEECSFDSPTGLCPKKPYISEDYQCVNGICALPSNGTKKLHEECILDSEECEMGLFCGLSTPFKSSGNSNIGECLPYCDLRYNNCPENGECFPLDVDNPAYRNIGVCIYGDCQQNSSCKDGESCKWLSPNVQICDNIGPMKVGKACNKNFNCDSNSICIEGECIRFCDFEGRKPCSDGFNCLSWSYVANGRTPSDFGICLPSCTPGVCGDESSYNEYCECEDNTSSYCTTSLVNDCSGICALIGEDKGLCVTDTCEQEDNNCPAGSQCFVSPENFFYSCLEETTGIVPMGETCSEQDECETGSFCMKLVSSEKICNRFCKNDDDCEGSTLSQKSFNCIKESKTSLAGVCVKNQCNPSSTENSCSEGKHCTLSSFGNYICQPTGDKEIGDTCSLLAENLISCGENLTCYKKDGETLSKCQQFCHNTSECPSGAECYRENNNDFLGLCRFPQ
ncbi:hypothetical protein JXR93_05015 [bacterium]|nr:hypothetical protein [bacterium]